MKVSGVLCYLGPHWLSPYGQKQNYLNFCFCVLQKKDRNDMRGESFFWVNYTLHLPVEGALEATTDVTPRGVGQLSLEPSRPFSMAQMEDLLLRLQLSGQPRSSCPIIQWGGNGTSPNASDITHSPLPKECLPRSINITDKQWPARTSSCAGLANASKDG